MATEKPVTFKAPKTLAECADRLHSTRQLRLDLQKQVDAYAAEESFLSEHLIKNLPKSQATGIAGKLIRATVVDKDVFQIKSDPDKGTEQSWTELRDYIVKNNKKNPGVWGLLNKAINQATAKEMDSAGKLPPGLAKISVPKISLTKLG